MSSTIEARPVPLGEIYRGVCRASSIPHVPSDSELRELCNFGYARGRCGCFPATGPYDSVRFAVIHDDGVALSVRYSMERDHLPGEHGVLAFQVAEACFDPRHPDDTVNRLAEAYVEAYRRSKERRAA